MIDQGEGHIIRVSLVHAPRVDAMHDSADYCASKAAVLNLTGELGKQLATYGIRVNDIAPGLFPTGMTARYWETPAREREAISKPLGRAGKEDDSKGLIVFLASPAADYIVGQTIVVDGAQTLV